MRIHYDINLHERKVISHDLHGDEIVQSGRYLIAKTLIEMGVANVDPLSVENPLIFSAGPLAGTPFSNANQCRLQKSSHWRD